MASISFTSTFHFLKTVFKKRFLLLQLPIVLFISITYINNFLAEDTSRAEGHSLITRLRAQEIDMVQFQQELAQLSKISGANNKYHISLFGFLLMKFFLYWSAIISTIIIGLAFVHNRALSIPTSSSMGKSVLLLFSYFFCLVLLAFPFIFIIQLLGTYVSASLLIVLTFLLSLSAFSTVLFLLSCFASALPILFDTNESIISALRKSYRFNKSHAPYILLVFISTMIVATLAFNLCSLPIYILLPYSFKIILKKYLGSLLATIGVMLWVSFYWQLAIPDTTKNHILPPQKE